MESIAKIPQGIDDARLIGSTDGNWSFRVL